MYPMHPSPLLAASASFLVLFSSFQQFSLQIFLGPRRSSF